MRALLKSKTSTSSAKKKPVGGLSALKQRRSTNQRSFVVRNKVNRNGIFIASEAPVFQSRDNFAFELEDRKGLFFLPALGYVGGRAEAEKIRSRVVADNMTQKEIDRIALAVEKRMAATFATKADLGALATKADLEPLAASAAMNARFDGVEKKVDQLATLVRRVTQTVSAADPRP